MGSSLFPDYTMEKNAYMKLKFWQIFKATKKSTGEKVSIFIFEKKIIDKKTEKEKNIILQLLKKEPEILLKYKNHKNILKIIEPLAEDSYSIGFITEYINYNLKEWIKEYKPTKFEIKYIIYQLMTGIISLHNDFQLSHNNLNIENIFLNDNFFVKISGLNLTTTLSKSNNGMNNNNITQTQLELYCDLKYCSPELILSNDINTNSDNFCIGLISYFLLKNDDLYFLMNNNFESYKSTYENTNIEKKITKFHDDNTEDFLMNLLNTNHEKRKSLLSLQNSKFFKESDDNVNNSNKLISLCLLSKMESVELSKNYELLKQLPNLFNLYSSKEKEFFILPNLLYYIKKENLINPILPSLFLLCEQKNSKINFSEKIWPNFKFLFNMKKLPAAALYLILKKISFFSENLEKNEFNKYCIPLICKALDCGVQKIQEVILDELPKILNELDKNEFKDNIYNKLINILIQTKNTKLKETILNFLNHLCDYFDSYFINNNFLDDIDKIVKNETTLYICKNGLILYEKLESKVNNKSFRSKIIPNLLLMMCNGEISEELFNKGDKIIKNFISKIKEQRKEQFVQEVVDVNINENDSDEIKENNMNITSEEEKKNKNKNSKNTEKNEIGVNSPLSLSGTKSFLSGNIFLLEYNSSEDSNLESKEKKSKNNNNNTKLNKKQKNQTKEKKPEFNNNNYYNNIHNDNLLDTLLFDEKNENEESLDPGIVDKNKSKNNILKYVDKKEFLSSLELKQVEAKKNQIENNNENIISNLIKDKNKEKENSEEKKENKKSNVNLWEEIESDDENNNKNETINKFIKKKKKSGSIKEKNKEKEIKTEKNEKINEKISSNKKWDEDEDDEENNNNKDNIQKNEENIINDNINNNIENKDDNNINKKNVVHKKIKKKKKKKKETKKELNLEEKINKVEIDEKEKEKEIEKNKSTTKINMEKRAANINLESLLDD